MTAQQTKKNQKTKEGNKERLVSKRKIWETKSNAGRYILGLASGSVNAKKKQLKNRKGEVNQYGMR